jgi:hypothetical protein
MLYLSLKMLKIPYVVVISLMKQLGEKMEKLTHARDHGAKLMQQRPPEPPPPPPTVSTGPGMH